MTILAPGFRKRLLAVAAVLLCAAGQGARAGGHGATSIPEAQRIQPQELASLLRSSTAEKPLILNVGPRLIYAQAHIPGAEYMGAGSEAQAIAQLRERAKDLPRGKFIVIYCGCCPWEHCPNMYPAFQALAELGFHNVKALYIAHNFGADWVDKGYPVTAGAGR